MTHDETPDDTPDTDPESTNDAADTEPTPPETTDRALPLSRRGILASLGLLATALVAFFGFGGGSPGGDPARQVGTDEETETPTTATREQVGTETDTPTAEPPDSQEQVGTAAEPLTALFTRAVNSGTGNPLVFTTNGTPALRLGTQGTAPDGDTGGANVVAGHENNAVTDGVVGATIGGGGSTGSGSIGDGTSRPNSNEVSADYGTVSGGRNNRAAGSRSTVGGGEQNTASSAATTVGGGLENTASGLFATVGGGIENTADDEGATVGGGLENTASDVGAVVGGGEGNTASSLGSTVGGGLENTARGFDATVVGGTRNTADGARATVAGGFENTAAGDYSFAAGRAAKARHRGAFVWGDSTEGNFESTGPNQFLVVASGGMGVGTARPRAQLHVVASEDGDADPEDHVAVIENRTAGSADVLALKLANRAPIGRGNNFVTFLDGAETGVGAIEGGGSGGGVTLNTASADYAEYLPRRDADEEIEPGDVVGVVGGAVTKRTEEAEQVLVVSDQPTVAGNSPGPTLEDRADHEVCAFVGQVPVRVRGPVAAGDLVVPSGNEDGIGRAVAPADYRPADGPIVGRAWDVTPTDDEGVHEVVVAVGLETGAALAGELARQRERADDLEAETDRLRAAFAAERETLRGQNAALRDRLAAVEARLAPVETDRTPSAPADD